MKSISFKPRSTSTHRIDTREAILAGFCPIPRVPRCQDGRSDCVQDALEAVFYVGSAAWTDLPLFDLTNKGSRNCASNSRVCRAENICFI